MTLGELARQLSERIGKLATQEIGEHTARFLIVVSVPAAAGGERDAHFAVCTNATVLLAADMCTAAIDSVELRDQEERRTGAPA